MATSPLRSPERPAHDEWGVYDPEQAGLSALFARLDSKAATKAAAETAAETAADKLTAKGPSRQDLRDSQ
ncbi:MAG: hypothetical protein Q7R30_19815 [Acidobacteriota bacterium]|nr:hypothetical protein [Acidobacteriota bacterium]